MAQTKAKPGSPGQRSGGSKKSKRSSRAKSASSNGKARSAKPKKARSGSKPKPASTSKPKPKSKSPSALKPKALIDKSKAAGETVEETAKGAGRAVGKAVGKAKVPLMAGGAALAGAAGGIALGRQGNRHRGLAAVKPKIKSKDLAKAARKAGDVGAQVGEIALEVQRARAESNGTHRSPVEVVLDGLTSRRPKRG